MRMHNINWIGLYTFARREIQRMFRVIIQTVVSPLISAALYIFIFGYVIGSKIETIVGVPYITFVFPGILMLNIMTSAFMHTSSSVYFGRFIRSIEEVLVSPFSHFEIVLGFVSGGVARAIIVAFGVLIIGLLFGAVTISNIFVFLFYVVAISLVFALLGMLVGLWAKSFEQLSILNTFVIMPLSYLGGIFYSVTMLPSAAQTITYLNPFFYFIDGIRSSMIGISEANTYIGLGMIVVLVFGLGALVLHLFRIGWRIRA